MLVEQTLSQEMCCPWSIYVERCITTRKAIVNG